MRKLLEVCLNLRRKTGEMPDTVLGGQLAEKRGTENGILMKKRREP